jgi:hypothetical protein
VTNQHKQRLAADESYLAASLKVPPPKKKTLRSEDASQRKIASLKVPPPKKKTLRSEGASQSKIAEGGGGHDAEAETKARSRVRFRLFLAFSEI